MEYQVKVEYTGTQGNGQKWISFMVSASKVNCGQYSFASLVHDIKSRCPSLAFLNERTMRLRYLDDEDSWINLNFDDFRGFTELWQCARVVPDREFKRVKLRAGVLGSPVQAAVSSSSTSSAVVRTAPFMPSCSSTAPFMPSVLETTHNEQASFQLKTSSTASTSSPVDRMLARKLENIETATKELENVTAQKENFERELSQAVLLNSGTLSVCGKCHLKLGHTRRNCDGEDCTSVMLCGILDRHPQEKSTRRSLAQKMIKCESQLANLQSDYNNKLQAYKSVEDSFARKIETDIIASNPAKYISNGVKNWALLNKHVALLQKKCNGKLPPRQTVTRLLDEAVREHEMRITVPHPREKGINPKKRILEEEYAINFPSRSTTTTCSFPFPPVVPPSEFDDFRLAVRLQDEWNNEDESTLSTLTPTSAVAENSSSDMYMFVPNEGCRAPSFEIEQEHEAANALVELRSLAKSD